MPVSWEALCWDLPPEVLDYKCFKTSISSSLRSPSLFIVIECAIECVRFSRDSLTEKFSLLCLLLFPLLLLSTFHILILLIIFAAKSNYSPLILYLSQNSPKRQRHFFFINSQHQVKNKASFMNLTSSREHRNVFSPILIAYFYSIKN